MTRRPLVGLTTYAGQARFAWGDAEAALLPLAYVRKVHAAGGRAVLITPDAPGLDVLDALDGVIFAGGPDVDPARYGDAPHPTTSAHPERDAAELLLMRGALDVDLPVLAICRGMQLMTVLYGGRLHQHLPDLLGHERHRTTGDLAYGAHAVRFAAGSLCHRVLGGSATVNSFHHQGVADPGRITASGWCAEDGLIEAVEDPAHAFAVGVQWHPENMPDSQLFAALVAAARARGRAAKAGAG